VTFPPMRNSLQAEDYACVWVIVRSTSEGQKDGLTGVESLAQITTHACRASRSSANHRGVSVGFARVVHIAIHQGLLSRGQSD
jgi:hypothetical protein